MDNLTPEESQIEFEKRAEAFKDATWKSWIVWHLIMHLFYQEYKVWFLHVWWPHWKIIEPKLGDEDADAQWT